MDCERRLRIIEIPCHLVMDWFAAAARGWAGASHIALPILDLPPDCKVLSVTHDAWSNKLLFRCSSASFDEVKDGEQIPGHFEHCRFETAELSQREREVRKFVVEAVEPEQVVVDLAVSGMGFDFEPNYRRITTPVVPVGFPKIAPEDATKGIFIPGFAPDGKMPEIGVHLREDGFVAHNYVAVGKASPYPTVTRDLGLKSWGSPDADEVARLASLDCWDRSSDEPVVREVK